MCIASSKQIKNNLFSDLCCQICMGTRITYPDLGSHIILESSNDIHRQI